MVGQGFGVTIVGVKRSRQDFVYARPETTIEADDLLIVCGQTSVVEIRDRGDRVEATEAAADPPLRAMYTSTPPSGVRFGSTTILNPLVPTNSRSRPGSDTLPTVPGAAFGSVLALLVLSSTAHVLPLGSASPSH